MRSRPRLHQSQVDPTQPHVLFVLNSLAVGGAERQVVSLLNRLDPARSTHALVCIKPGGALGDALTPGATACWPDLGVQRGFEWRAVRELARRIDAQRVDLLVCTNLYALLYGWLAQRLCQRRIQLVEVFHTTDLGSWRERVEMAFYRLLLRRVDLLVYVCEGQAAQWRAQGLRARADQVIHNGIDMRQFENRWSAADHAAVHAAHGLAAGDCVVGLCAVMRPEKAHGDLLLALAQLRREGLQIRALLIGDGPERGRIEEQICDLGLGDAVRITGLLPDVRATVAACDVMVLTSHAVETFSIAALEALALGKPMVMTRIGGATEQVQHGETGLLYAPGDLGALADALRQLTDPALRQAMGERAATRVRQRFSIERMVASYEQALAALAADAVTVANPSEPVTR